MGRESPKNLIVEPPYPGIDGMVILNLSNPDWTGHLKHPECEIEEPHKIDDCGLWRNKMNNTRIDRAKAFLSQPGTSFTAEELLTAFADAETQQLKSRIADLEAALEEVVKGEGVFSVEPLVHAGNTIENMKRIAYKALSRDDGICDKCGYSEEVHVIPPRQPEICREFRNIAREALNKHHSPKEK